MDLKPIPVSSLSALPGLKKLWISDKGKTLRDLDDETQDDGPGLDHDEKFILTPTRRYQNLMHVRHATDLLDRLPADNETFHMRLSGRFPLWSFIPAVVQLAAPVTISNLELETLSFNNQTIAELLELLDAGKIERLAILVSHFFAEQNAEIYDPAKVELERRGHQIRAMRTHAKIANLELTDGRCFNLRSSANLRSCKNVEQADMTGSRELYEWDHGIFTQLMNRKKDNDRT